MKVRLGTLVSVLLTITPVHANDCVILLHGLIRSPDSMSTMAESLEDAGFRVANTGYPSRDHTIDELAPKALKSGIDQCIKTLDANTESQIHIVTHSLGGILTRVYLHDHTIERLGRVVMLGPPNQGSEAVDELKGVPGFDVINGPAGSQLGTDADSVPRKLGAVDFEVGVIAGSNSMNPLLSHLLPDEDDGKVSVAATRVEGMQDFITLPVTHTFMMRDEEVLRQTLHFLIHGRFDHPASAPAPSHSPGP